MSSPRPSELLKERVKQLSSNAHKILEAILSAVEKFLLVRAPPGFGKTLASVAFSLIEAYSGRRTAIFVRTRKEIEHTLRIYWTLTRNLESPPLLIPLTGKEALCRFPPEDPLCLSLVVSLHRM